MMDAKRAQLVARLGGALYLYIIIIGAMGEAVVRGSIVVSGNPAATAANLRSMEWLWRAGVASEVTLLICATVLALILYVLLRPVSADLALLAVFFNLVSIAVEGVAAVSLATTLAPIRSATYASSFSPEQLNSLATLSIRSHTAGFTIALIFFGAECVVLGYLIYRSGYVSRSIGVLMQIAGVCYCINSFAWLLSPSLSSRLFPLIVLPSFVAELSLALWLLVKGVRTEQWNQRLADLEPASGSAGR